MSESKATKSSLLKSTVAASTQRWQKNPEEQTGPKWNNALSRKVSLEPQKTPPAKKYDVSSKFTSPTKSSSSKETVKMCDRAPPSVASPPAAINEHSRLLQKSTASFLASQRQKCPLDNLKVFHTVVNPKATHPDAAAKLPGHVSSRLEGVRSKLYVPTASFALSKYVPPTPVDDSPKPLPGAKADMREVKSRLMAPTAASERAKYTPQAAEKKQRVKRARTLARSYSESALENGSPLEVDTKRRSVDDFNYQTPRMTKLVAQRLSYRKSLEDSLVEGSGSPSHDTHMMWNNDTTLHESMMQSQAQSGETRQRLTTRERREAMHRLLKLNTAALAGQYVKPPSPEAKPKDFDLISKPAGLFPTSATLSRRAAAISAEERREAQERLLKPNAASLAARWISCSPPAAHRSQHHNQGHNLHHSHNREEFDDLDETRGQQPTLEVPSFVDTIVEAALASAFSAPVAAVPQRPSSPVSFRLAPAASSGLDIISPSAQRSPKQVAAAISATGLMKSTSAISPIGAGASGASSTVWVAASSSFSDGQTSRISPQVTLDGMPSTPSRVRQAPLPILALTTLSAANTAAPGDLALPPRPTVTAAAVDSRVTPLSRTASDSQLVPRRTPLVAIEECQDLITRG